MYKLNNTYIINIVILFIIGVDQATKRIAVEYLKGMETLSFFHNTLILDYMENHGAFLGLGNTLPEEFRSLIFSIVVPLVLITMIIYIQNHTELSKKDMVFAGLIIGGGISNVLDRLYNNGGVIDFLNIGIGSLRTGIFNLADIAITCSVLIYIWLNVKKV